MSTRNLTQLFTDQDISDTSHELKIGLLATISDLGLPHITLLSTLQANTPSELTWGQFTEGLSKTYIRQNPNCAFLILSLDRFLWRGKAIFRETRQEGTEYDRYNNVPMFRYNAYFGIHTVYFMDLIQQTGKNPLPMGQIVPAALKTILLKTFNRKQDKPVLNRWTRQLLNRISNLKFLSYIGEDGFPTIIPVIQAQAQDSQNIIFSTSAYNKEFKPIPEGVTVALFGMSFDMEDVLLRGIYGGIHGIPGLRYGTLKVNWVYNSMPPVPQQIYPPLPIQAVTEF